jgi:anaerobic selenocysteine-containing dehydrogenase
MDRVLPPAGEARSMSEIVRALAERLGVADLYPSEGEVGHVAHPDHRYATPSGKIELYSKQAEAGRLPLELRTGRSINHFHAFFDHGRALPAPARREPGPELCISPADAAARGIADGAAIRIHNERGVGE